MKEKDFDRASEIQARLTVRKQAYAGVLNGRIKIDIYNSEISELVRLEDISDGMRKAIKSQLEKEIKALEAEFEKL